MRCGCHFFPIELLSRECCLLSRVHIFIISAIFIIGMRSHLDHVLNHCMEGRGEPLSRFYIFCMGLCQFMHQDHTVSIIGMFYDLVVSLHSSSFSEFSTFFLFVYFYMTSESWNLKINLGENFHVYKIACSYPKAWYDLPFVQVCFCALLLWCINIFCVEVLNIPCHVDP